MATLNYDRYATTEAFCGRDYLQKKFNTQQSNHSHQRLVVPGPSKRMNLAVWKGLCGIEARRRKTKERWRFILTPLILIDLEHDRIH